jgi:hypothetical protein
MEKIRYFCECGFDQETTAWMTATGLELKLTPASVQDPGIQQDVCLGQHFRVAESCPLN